MKLNAKVETTQRDIMIDWVAQNYTELTTERVMFEKAVDRFGMAHCQDNAQHMVEELNRWLNQ